MIAAGMGYRGLEQTSRFKLDKEESPLFALQNTEGNHGSPEIQGIFALSLLCKFHQS